MARGRGWMTTAWCLLLLCTAVNPQSRRKDSSLLTFLVGESVMAVDSLTKMITNAFTSGESRSTRAIMGQHQMSNRERFMCDTKGYRSMTPPTSVHRLMPGDIDVVAAMGDSLTAGNGAFATNLAQLFLNDRGISWSIGGQGDWRSYLTLPNILKEFNPRLTGYSLGKAYSYSKMARLNVAVAGAIDDDILYQAQVLVKRMRNDPAVDMKNHWKVITMLIGANDICIFLCTDPVRHHSDMHLKQIRAALDYLQQNVPRTLVNLVLVPDIMSLGHMRNKPQVCEIMHALECPCLFGANAASKAQLVNATIHGYRKVERELIESGRYDTRDDFTVVLQEYTEIAVTDDMKDSNGYATMDLSLFSVDCFHLSQRGNAYAANALWNNMLEPVGFKAKHWAPEFQTVKCPTADSPYIFTNKNSRDYLSRGTDTRWTLGSG
ncbi:phospholipase B1, membrane-associated-like [Ischnura elegans]|uniref:phospholipase B1, membrane-associated-like n=1 Tax=Ischnura elegans TaxID=197161 RepID=UPI001ED87EA0|nr:phospholipase B1, membrane-associated-like [Ischnura elegans]XP_046392279.1 phospholipase B1, membrane-associated-like [Ischnura elegans]